MYKPNPFGLDLISFMYFILGIINIFSGCISLIFLQLILIDLSGLSRLFVHLSFIHSEILLILLGIFQITLSYGLAETKIWAFLLALIESTANIITAAYFLFPVNNLTVMSIMRLIINMIIIVYLICRFPHKKYGADHK